jgi:hypothetical protein
VSNTHSVLKRQCGRHDFDLMKTPKSSRITIQRVTQHNIEEAWELANQEIPGDIASISTIKDIVIHNPDSAMLICRDKEIIGIWAMLMLSPFGLEELLVGKFVGTKPDFRWLAPEGVAPAAIYFWVAVAPGLAVGGVMQVSQVLRNPLFRHANCFSRPNTPAGERFNIAMGFEPVTCGTPGLYRYVRLANRDDEFKQAA